MIRISFYVSETKDPDLCGLLKDLGTNQFREVTKMCICGLFDKQSADVAVKLAQEKPVQKKKPEFTDGFSRIRIVISNNDELEGIFEAIKPNLKSPFIKSLIRQVLGPQVLLKYYLRENANAFFAESVYVPVRTVNIVSNVPLAVPIYERTDEFNHKMQINGEVEEKEESSSHPVSEEISSSYAENYTSSIPLLTEDSDTEDSSGDDDFDILSMLEAMM